ncbi:hypothetical protein GGX14DRAFT_618215 [Mycena pura]|uniref:F-box domain-containing protein n=1 Tax=Mycena pura TaxID=153505 RepID=A0AAD6YHL0_9AGAR|nr:hypothetical protein GGX14DRAFT_618215 [Mycena pura]
MLESLLEPLPLNPESYVNRLLHSNDVPLDWEALVIRSIVSDGEDRLSQRRDETVEHNRVHRAILSPIRRMPMELVCTIFALASAQNTPPWQLGFICRSWRHYALSYPILWSSVTVPCYPRFYERKMQRLLSKLQTQLSRATNASLDVHWSCNDPDSRLLGLILPHSNRWRNVSFHVTNKCRLDWLLPTSGKLDRLETLEVENFGATTFPDVFTTAPNLRRVVLTQLAMANRYTPPIYLKSIPIPWGQITHYRGVFPGVRQVKFLQAAPNLLNCALEIAECSNFTPPANTTIILPHLRRLCLDGAASLLNVMAPELDELCFEFAFGMWVPHLIIPFIRRASCTLTRLVLWKCCLCAELTVALRSLPTLSYLLLENTNHDEKERFAFFATMAISGTDSDVCPHIVSMVYGYEGWDNHSTQDAFISMAMSRLRTQHSLRSQLSRLRVFRTAGCLERYDPPTLDMKHRIQMLQDEGLDVAFLRLCINLFIPFTPSIVETLRERMFCCQWCHACCAAAAAHSGNDGNHSDGLPGCNKFLELVDAGFG